MRGMASRQDSRETGASALADGSKQEGPGMLRPFGRVRLLGAGGRSGGRVMLVWVRELGVEVVKARVQDRERRERRRVVVRCMVGNKRRLSTFAVFWRVSWAWMRKARSLSVSHGRLAPHMNDAQITPVVDFCGYCRCLSQNGENVSQMSLLRQDQYGHLEAQ